MFGSLLKVTLSPIDLAVGMTADIVTLGGVLTDEEKLYTAQAAERLMTNAEDVFEQEEKK